MKRLILCLAITGLCTSSFAQSPPKPIVMLNGQVVKDTANLNSFERIDYLSGKKGVELFGSKGGKGVIIIQADGKIPLYGEVISTKGKKIKHAEVISKEGKVLTTTNDCGTFFLQAVAIGEMVTVRRKGFLEQNFVVQQSKEVIKLAKNK